MEYIALLVVVCIHLYCVAKYSHAAVAAANDDNDDEGDRHTNHFPGRPELAGCQLDSHSPVIFILSILTGQGKNSSCYP